MALGAALVLTLRQALKLSLAQHVILSDAKDLLFLRFEKPTRILRCTQDDIAFVIPVGFVEVRKSAACTI